MKNKLSIQSQISRLFFGFTFVLSLIYSLLLLGYSWVVEDNIFNRLVENEARFVIDYYEKNKKITQPQSQFFSLYSDWKELPGNIDYLHQKDPERIEFQLPSGGSLHLKPIVLGDKQFILAADVSAFEIGKEYLPFVSVWLVLIIIMISGLSLLVSVILSKRTLAPLKRLTEKVAASKSIDIDQTFSDEFPDNEVGYLADTFEKSILHLQKVLRRESDFTRDASHELRTPITILRNIESKTRQSLRLSTKDMTQFSYAVSQLQLTVTTLLAMAREESLEKEELSLLAVLEDCIINHYELNQNKDFELQIDVAKSLKVCANRNLLKILFNNLLSNAVNYAEGNSLSIKNVGNDIYFENEASKFELADPFRANSRGDNSQGIGLGLNLVKRLCLSFDWQINLKRETDKFCIIISTSN